MELRQSLQVRCYYYFLMHILCTCIILQRVAVKKWPTNAMFSVSPIPTSHLDVPIKTISIPYPRCVLPSLLYLPSLMYHLSMPLTLYLLRMAKIPLLGVISDTF